LHLGVDHPLDGCYTGRSAPMEHDRQVTLKNFKSLFTLPLDAGTPTGMIQFRGQLLITTDQGYLYSYDMDSQTLTRITPKP
jgi:hypothetical protein